MDKVIALIQCRTGSTRLPNKCFLPWDDKTVIERVVNQARKAKTVNKVVVVVPWGDNKLIRYLLNRDIDVFAGHPTDVLDRFWQCVKLTDADHVVRLTADCPLLTGEIIDEVVNLYKESDRLYVTNRLTDPMYPDGMDVEVFYRDTLEFAWKHYIDAVDREHVTPRMKHVWASDNVQVHCPDHLLPYKDSCLSIDTMEDYQNIINWYKEHPLWPR